MATFYDTEGLENCFLWRFRFGGSEKKAGNLDYMDIEKLQRLMRAFVLCQFSYCPLVWMFHDRALNQRINHIHERAMRIAYKDYENDFGFLLEQSKSVPIHARNLQLLMTEIYKTKSGLNPSFMKDIFMQRNISYSLRNGDDAQLPKV